MKLAQSLGLMLLIPTLALGQRGDWIVNPQIGYGVTYPIQSSTIYSRDKIPRNKPYYSFGLTITRKKFSKKTNWAFGVCYTQKSYVDIYGLPNMIDPKGQLIRIGDTLTASISHRYLDFPAHLNFPIINKNLSLRIGGSIGVLWNGNFVGRSIRTGKFIESETLKYRGTDALLPRFGTFHLGVLYTKELKNIGIGIEPFLDFEAPTIVAVIGIRRTHYFHKGNLVFGIRTHIPIRVNQEKSYYPSP